MSLFDITVFPTQFSATETQSSAPSSGPRGTKFGLGWLYAFVRVSYKEHISPRSRFNEESHDYMQKESSALPCNIVDPFVAIN